MAPLYTRGPPSAPNFLRRTIVQLQRPSPQPALTCDRLERLFSGHSSDTPPHLCPFFAMRASLHFRPCISLPAPAAPRSSATCRRPAAGSDDLPPAGASSTAHQGQRRHPHEVSASKTAEIRTSPLGTKEHGGREHATLVRFLRLRRPEEASRRRERFPDGGSSKELYGGSAYGAPLMRDQGYIPTLIFCKIYVIPLGPGTVP